MTLGHRIPRSAAMGPLLLVAVAGCGSSASEDSGGGTSTPLKATALSVGYSSACAVVDDGGVVCWGTNINDLLGKDSDSELPFSTTVPTHVAGIGERVTSISMGTDSACAVTVSGRVWCWGSNCYDGNSIPDLCLTGGDGGQFGEAAPSAIGVPVPITGLSGEATAVSVGTGFACALMARGTVECWGAGDLGQTGNQDMSNLVPEPVSGLEHATAVSAGTVSACAITAGGGVVCWGDNDWGQLGNNSAANSAVPVQVSGLTTGVTSITVGLVEACAVTASGAAVCWGENNIPQGSAAPTHTAVPMPIAGLTQGTASVSLAPSGQDACAVTQPGGVVCWGGGAQGQLGNGSAANTVAPVPVNGLTSGVTRVALGQGFACALTRAGRVECWGAVLGAQIKGPGDAKVCRYIQGDMPCSDTALPVSGF
jgi:alpha-tubulin suppressor-like RCC1 family protein